MFKHFAIITLAITLCIAMFANGEGTQEVADRLSARAARTQLLRDEAQKMGPRHFRMNNLKLSSGDKSYMPFAPDENQFIDETRGVEARYGQNEADLMSRRRASATAALQLPGGAPGMGPNSAGAPPITMETAPGGAAKAKRRPTREAPRKPTETEAKAMMDASEARAGAATQ